MASQAFSVYKLGFMGFSIPPPPPTEDILSALIRVGYCTGALKLLVEDVKSEREEVLEYAAAVTKIDAIAAINVRPNS